MSSTTHGSQLRDLEIDKIRKELDELNKEKRKQERQKKEEFTLAQQMLILHYLGVIKAIGLVNTKKALLLSKLLNRDKNNIREILTYVSSPRIAHSIIKNKNNLEILVPLFNKLGMAEIVERLNIDISKVNDNLKLKSLQPPLH